jgi:DNA-binding transcriptional ArsR family regulator
MSLFSRLKKLFGTEEEQKQDSKENDLDMSTPMPEQGTFSEPIKEQITVENTYSAIKAWEKTMEAAKQHPLSQVKIINTQILEDLNNVLKQMNTKLDKLDKLEEILAILHETKQDLSQKGIETTQLDKAIAEIERLTIKDKEVINWIAKQDKVTAKQLSDYIGLSRSTASFRLNRLAELGALEKEAVGKKIYYKIKIIQQ